MNILIIYASIDGQTKKISEYLAEKINKDSSVTLVAIDDISSVELNDFEMIILGAAIRYSKYNKKVYKFVKQNKELLKSKKNAFFTVSGSARKDGKDNPATNTYVNKFIAKSNWQPQQMAIFAGRINYSLYGFFDKHFIRFIMKLTSGPTELDTNIEFTNWQKVDEFCEVCTNT